MFDNIVKKRTEQSQIQHSPRFYFNPQEEVTIKPCGLFNAGAVLRLDATAPVQVRRTV
jgi:hypothetical protein